MAQNTPPIKKIVAIKKSKTMKRLTKTHFLKTLNKTLVINI
ncbi:hypothetical protein HpNP4_03660 [Helicobacter pylori]